MADVLGFLKKAAPWITAAATSNVPALIGLAAQAVSGVTKGKVDASPDAIADAIAGATPEQLAAMKQADDDLKLKLTQLGFQNAEELQKIAADDRASARTREITLRDRVPSILAFLITAGFFCTLLLAFTKGVNDQSRDLANIMIGTLGTAWVSVVTYYFGSSAGSAEKSELMATMKPKTP